MRSLEDCQPKFGKQLEFPFPDPLDLNKRLFFEFSSESQATMFASPVKRSVSFRSEDRDVILQRLSTFLLMQGVLKDGESLIVMDTKVAPRTDYGLNRHDAP